jgi:hypothetical protein
VTDTHRVDASDRISCLAVRQLRPRSQLPCDVMSDTQAAFRYWAHELTLLIFGQANLRIRMSLHLIGSRSK